VDSKKFSDEFAEYSQKLSAVLVSQIVRLGADQKLVTTSPEKFNIAELIDSFKTGIASSVIANVITLEYEARALNKALLLRGTSFEKVPVELAKRNVDKPKEIMVIGSPILYDKNKSFIESYNKGKGYDPYSISFGNSLFAGVLKDRTATAYNFLVGIRLGSKMPPSKGALGYALLVDKKII
jgi:hypothetical protein